MHNQFHDVLPGTSIPRVFEDCRADYARVEHIGQEMLSRAQEALVSRIHTNEEAVVVFNPLAWSRGGLIELPWSESLAGKALSTDGGRLLTSQLVDIRGKKTLLIELDFIPSLGYHFFPLTSLSQANADAYEITVTPTLLENRFYRLTMDERGEITSLFDKANQREILTAPGNVLQIFEDRSTEGEAWEIDIFYQDKMRQVDHLVDAKVEESGHMRGVLRLTWRFANTTIIQSLTIYGNSPRIDFRTELVWHEHQILLKAAFPVNVCATRAM